MEREQQKLYTEQLKDLIVKEIPKSNVDKNEVNGIKKYFITFANTQGQYATERICNEVRLSNMFDYIFGYTENDFDEEFKSLCGDRFETHKRGYGYWSWKPYVIKKTLNMMKDNDILVYADAGSSFINSRKDKMDDLFKMVQECESGIVSPTQMIQSDRFEDMWTKFDLFNYIDQEYNYNNKEIFYNSYQILSRLIILRKTTEAIKFINNWLNVMIYHFDLVNDSPSKLQNSYRFIENRHDQSVLSLLLKTLSNAIILNTNGEYGEDGSGPIVATRKKRYEYNLTENDKIIYVYSHKDYKNYPKEQLTHISISHKIITTPLQKQIIITDEDIISHEWSYAEVCGLEYLYKHKYILPSIVGYAHYRDWLDDETLGDYDVILPTPLLLSIREQYKRHHNVNDFDDVVEIIKTILPTYKTKFNKVYARNMFIMRKSDFINYTNFLFTVLEKFNQKHSLKNDDDIYKYVQKNMNFYNTGCNIQQQARLQGYLSERISTIFFLNYFKEDKIKEVKMNIIDKYNV